MATIPALQADIARLQARLGDTAAEANYKRAYGMTIQQAIAGHYARIDAIMQQEAHARTPAPVTVLPVVSVPPVSVVPDAVPRVILPVVTSPPAASPVNNVKPYNMVYVVKWGDTLTSIARRHGVTIGEILRRNPGITNPDRIFEGQRINIPSAVAPAPAVPRAVTPAPAVPRAVAPAPVTPAAPVAAPAREVTVEALLADIARLEARLGDTAAEANYKRAYGMTIQQAIAGHRSRIAAMTGAGAGAGAAQPGRTEAERRMAQEAEREAAREAAKHKPAAVTPVPGDVTLFAPETMQAIKEAAPLLIVGLVVLKIIRGRR